jgi:hypothetical protein
MRGAPWLRGELGLWEDDRCPDRLVRRETATMKVRWRSRRFRRFTLAMLLFLMSCVGGGLGGYIVGHRQGLRSMRPVLSLYDITGLVPCKSQHNGATVESVDELVEAIKSEVDFDDWDDTKSRARLKAMPDGQALLVEANSGGHEVIREVLRTFRPLVGDTRITE